MSAVTFPVPAVSTLSPAARRELEAQGVEICSLCRRAADSLDNEGYSTCCNEPCVVAGSFEDSYE